MNQPISTSRLQGPLLPRKNKKKKNDVSLIYGIKKERSQSKRGKSSQIVRKDTDTYDFPEFQQYKMDISKASNTKRNK